MGQTVERRRNRLEIEEAKLQVEGPNQVFSRPPPSASLGDPTAPILRP